jgi:hypothetical protein
MNMRFLLRVYHDKGNPLQRLIRRMRHADSPDMRQHPVQGLPVPVKSLTDFLRADRQEPVRSDGHDPVRRGQIGQQILPSTLHADPQAQRNSPALPDPAASVADDPQGHAPLFGQGGQQGYMTNRFHFLSQL